MMKIKKVFLENFRGYQNKTEMDFSDFTALVGRNDVGKSTFLEALDIFFNDTKAYKKIDSTDINVSSKEDNNNSISISVEFSDLPEKYPYNRVLKNGSIKVCQITKTEIIRHQIHHPENKENVPYSEHDLSLSIDRMLDFIKRKKALEVFTQ